MRIGRSLQLAAGLLILTAAVMAIPSIYPTGVTINQPGVAPGFAVVPDGSTLHMIEPDGTVVHSWFPPCGWTYLARPIEDGHILVRSCGNLMELDWNSNVVWEFVEPPEGYPPTTQLHHDWVRLDNGNTLTLARNVQTVPSLSPRPVVDDFILEIDPAGEIVWEWHTVDHVHEWGLSQERLDEIAARGGDFSHLNAVAPIPAGTAHTDPRFQAGNLVLSFRYQGITVLDRSTDQIVWFNDTLTVGQHDALMIPPDLPGGGNIMAFDNGHAGEWDVTHNRDYSRIVEIDPEADEIVWEYNANDSGLSKWTFFSSFVAGSQRLPNGNTFICEGMDGRVFEVTPQGQIVWEFIHPAKNPNDYESNTIYRAYKVPLDFGAGNFTPDLVLTELPDADPVASGGTVSYSIRIDNVGPDPAVDVQLVDATPPGASFESIDAPAGWDCSTPVYGGTGGVSCTGEMLGAGDSATILLTLRVDDCDAPPSLDRALSVTSLGLDWTPTDNATASSTAVTETACASGGACTVGRCDAGQCVVDPVVCEPVDGCRTAGVCNPGTSLCESGDPLPDDTLCDDSDPATCDDRCATGSCGGTLVPEPAEVVGLLLDQTAGTATLKWGGVADLHNLYAGTIAGGAFAYDHTCTNLGAPIFATSTSWTETPPAGEATYFLITRVDACRESIAGRDSAGLPRTQPSPCPS